jgi:hypothetical protein
MKQLRSVLTVAGALVFAGCYHAIINTGATPNGQTIKEEWAHSFVHGLVPPKVIETAQRCPGGVARVETQLSFLNMVATAVTFGIYSPMTIEVQCAGGGRDQDEDLAIAVRRDATTQEKRAAVTRAVTAAQAAGQALYIQFE